MTVSAQATALANALNHHLPGASAEVLPPADGFAWTVNFVVPGGVRMGWVVDNDRWKLGGLPGELVPDSHMPLEHDDWSFCLHTAMVAVLVLSTLAELDLPNAPSPARLGGGVAALLQYFMDVQDGKLGPVDASIARLASSSLTFVNDALRSSL